MIHQRLVFLLGGNFFARFNHHVIECLGLINLLLHKNEEILWNLSCVFVDKSFEFRVGWYFIQWTVGKVISCLNSWKLSFVTNYQVSSFVQETNSGDWLCKFDFSNEFSSEVPNFDKSVLVARHNELQVAMKINRRYFFIMLHLSIHQKAFFKKLLQLFSPYSPVRVHLFFWHILFLHVVLLFFFWKRDS